MARDIEAPEGWTEVDTEFEQQLRAFMRSRDGLVVSVERGTAHGSAYSVVTLPENFHEDNQPIDHVADVDGETDAEQAALSYMESNQR